MSRSHCPLETGAVIFYERFEGVEGLKDRYFIVLVNSPPVIECFTTTTRPHALTKPKLATEFCRIEKGECCLPKECFVDFRTIHSFDDIQMASRLRSRSVKYIGDLPGGTLRKIRTAFSACRSQPPVMKERIVRSLDLMIVRIGNPSTPI